MATSSLVRHEEQSKVQPEQRRLPVSDRKRLDGVSRSSWSLHVWQRKQDLCHLLPAVAMGRLGKVVEYVYVVEGGLTKVERLGFFDVFSTALARTCIIPVFILILILVFIFMSTIVSV